MRRLCFLVVVLLAGCQNVTGPFEQRKTVRVDDPGLSLSEQQRLGRSRLAYPEASLQAAPPSGVITPSTTPLDLSR
jgi:hypothetical protein